MAAGFELSFAGDGGLAPSVPGPPGKVAGLGPAAARRMCRETVSRCTSNRLAIAR